MDAFSDETTEKIVFVKPTQVGGTSAMENALGSLIDQDPAPAMFVYPSDELAERTVEAKLEPMIRQCKALAEKYREHDSKRLALKFRDMIVYLTGANSPASLASTPIRYLFLDEVDKFPGATKKEADPVSLAIERTKTFFNRKIFMASTPTLKTGPIWKAKEEADAEKHYFVPCPHCGQFIELKFAQIKWPSKDDVPDQAERAEMATYVCQACGCIITDRDKAAMLQAGRWQIVRQTTTTPKSVAYWMNTLYSPFTRFSDIAREFMRAKDDPELLHNFVNSWLAEPWEDTKLKTNADGGSGLVPPGVDKTADRRDRRAGKLPVLGDPSMGRLYDLPKRGPWPGAFHGRGGASYEHRVFPAGRRKGHGGPGPDGQRRPDRRGV